MLNDEISVNGGHHQIYVKGGKRDSDGTNHSFVWWFSPVVGSGFENARIENNLYLHKTYEESCAVNEFVEKYEGEEIVEAIRFTDESLSMDEIPGSVLEELMRWFGTELVRRSVEHDGGELPTHLYECISCDVVFEHIPVSVCPECGEDSLVIHEDEQTIGDNRELLETLTNSEVTSSVEDRERFD